MTTYYLVLTYLGSRVLVQLLLIPYKKLELGNKKIGLITFLIVA